ncbi:MAG: hypothetical protein ABFS22_09275 [Pseudomonadota bacterium]
MDILVHKYHAGIDVVLDWSLLLLWPGPVNILLVLFIWSEPGHPVRLKGRK